jgi:hypothetical protein
VVTSLFTAFLSGMGAIASGVVVAVSQIHAGEYSAGAVRW